MFEFLTTPEGQRVTAFVTAAIIAFAFFIHLRPFKSNNRLVVPVQPDELLLWVAEDYYMYVRSLVRASNTMEQLNATMPIIDGFFDKEFRVPISTIDRKKYYSRLLETYCQKEQELTTIPLTLCKN